MGKRERERPREKAVKGGRRTDSQSEALLAAAAPWEFTRDTVSFATVNGHRMKG